jgi:hypothetical protein
VQVQWLHLDRIEQTAQSSAAAGQTPAAQLESQSWHGRFSKLAWHVLGPASMEGCRVEQTHI